MERRGFLALGAVVATGCLHRDESDGEVLAYTVVERPDGFEYDVRDETRRGEIAMGARRTDDGYLVGVRTVAPNDAYGATVEDVRILGGAVNVRVRTPREERTGGDETVFPEVFVEIETDDGFPRISVEVLDGWSGAHELVWEG